MSNDVYDATPPHAPDGEPARAVDPDGPVGSGDTPTPAPRRWAAGHAIIAVVIALVLGGLFNASDLLATAERQEFGSSRDLSIAAAERLLAVSQALRLDRPRAGIDQALGRSDSGVGPDAPALDDEVELDEAPEPGDETLAGPDPADDGTGASTDDAPDADAAPDGAAAEDEVEPQPETEPEIPERAPITEADPLTMYIGGDSMVGQFGTALEDLADDTGVITTTEILYEFGSGLSRPDFIDWPAIMTGVSAELDPEVIVLYFGGNDAQALDIGGTVREPEDPEWQAEYRSRVSALMTQLQEAGHTIYWMGMPIPRSDTLQTRYLMLNEIYSSEADAHEAVTFVPAWDVFAGPDGAFSEYLPNQNGDVVDMRLDDGIHYTTAGAYRIARVVADRIIADHGITPAA